MKFKIIDRIDDIVKSSKSKAFLIWDNWNDYQFYTAFELIYLDENSQLYEIGPVKIGYIGQQEGDDKRLLAINDTFDELEQLFFSLGQSDSYYETLGKLDEYVRDEILIGLRDIAKLPDVYNIAIEEEVTRVSLLRVVSQTSVIGQFRRLANGNAKLIKYKFKYNCQKMKGGSSRMLLSFNVIPNAFPPTNIHVVIGRNGVGKTYLINDMINALIVDDDGKRKKYGEFLLDDKEKENQFFANLIAVSFSAFDESEPMKESKDKTKGIQFSYIGLKRIKTEKEKRSGPKSTTMLKNEFFNSLALCKTSSKKNRWKKCIEMLESDPNFQGAGISQLIDIDEKDIKISNNIFKRLSSGHKIVLLTITRLIETLQERSLVLIDEPESHLHPPLLSAFTRALSNLLITANGVAIISTHSPVILQEVPKSCVWKLSRSGAETKASRLEIESFGENVGTLTSEVFGLEVSNSGFYKLLEQALQENRSYEAVLNQFNNQLGMEAKAIIRALTIDDRADS